MPEKRTPANKAPAKPRKAPARPPKPAEPEIDLLVPEQRGLFAWWRGTPTLDSVNRKASGALLAVVFVAVGFLGTGYVLVHNDHEQRSERRRDFCDGIHYALEGPLIDSFAKAANKAPDDPEVIAAKRNVREGLGPDCIGPAEP